MCAYTLRYSYLSAIPELYLTIPLFWIFKWFSAVPIINNVTVTSLIHKSSKSVIISLEKILGSKNYWVKECGLKCLMHVFHKFYFPKDPIYLPN